MIVIDQIVDLGAVERVIRRHAGAVGARTEVRIGGRATDVDELTVAEVDQTEDEQTVLDDRAAEVEDDVGGFNFIEAVLGQIGVRRVRTQGVGFPVRGDAEFPLVAARLGRAVQHATGAATELRRIAAGLGFKRLIELERNGRRPGEVTEFRDVQAVDEVGVLTRRGTADGRNAAEGIVRGRHAGSEQGHGTGVTGDRHVARQLLNVDGQAGGGGVELGHGGPHTDDDEVVHGRGARGAADGENHRGGAARSDGDDVRQRGIARCRDSRRVAALRQGDGAERTGSVGRIGTGEALRHRLQRHGGAGDGRLRLRFTGAGDGALHQVLGHGGAGSQQADGRSRHKRHEGGTADHGRMQQTLANGLGFQA